MIAAIEGILTEVLAHSVVVGVGDSAMGAAGGAGLAGGAGGPGVGAASPMGGSFLGGQAGKAVGLMDEPAGGGGIEYELQVSAYGIERLGGSVGRAVRLLTIHYLESPNQGMMFLPRLAGFTSRQEREVFLLLTSVKGIGYRKALRIMAMDPARIVEAIAQGDTRLLSSLPELGKKTADLVVSSGRERAAELAGVLAGPVAGGVGGSETGGGMPGGLGVGGGAGVMDMTREAVEGLVALGENRLDAERWVRQVAAMEPAAGNSAELIQRVFTRRQTP